jgi:sigma-B regulation protein RsbU (phosphoserine phosphatase)
MTDLVGDLSHMVWELSPDNFYATMFCARVDSARSELEYVNAGHDRAILVVDNATRAINLESTGTVLGLNPHTAFEQRTIRLAPGDILVAVTDGITDAIDGEEEDPEQTVLAAVRERHSESSIDLTKRIFRAFDNGMAPLDDRTVVAVRFPGSVAEVPFMRPRRQHALAYAAA